MLDFPRWKVWAVSLLCLLGMALSIPTFVPEARMGSWPELVSSSRVNLGLDLAGGSQLLLEADTSDVAAQRLEQMEEIMRGELRRSRIQAGDISTSDNRISFIVRNPADVDAVVELARNQTQPVGLGGQRTWNVNVVDGNRVVITPTQSGLEEALNNAMNSAREVVYNRVDPEGVKEVTVVRQGKDRILVEVPGLKDPEGLKALLGKTARLEFKLVAPDQSGVATGRAGVGTQILPQSGGGRMAVVRRAIVTGDRLVDATQGFDQTTNEPVVNIRFDNAGSKAFGRVTQQNVGKPFAIVLDDVILSAPSIREPILGGQAQISGSFTVESAGDLAVQLRSGKLPVELKVIEERTVGPELGRDSIRSAVIAGAIGTVGILLFMFVTYGRFGFYADLALVLNVIVILGIMALFNSTLTLPGIAGFVLTVGAAVDANVIINERIREEQRRGRRIMDAIEHGYNEARTAIFDANITNVIAGMLLY